MGLKYGDENPETEKQQLEDFTKQYKPLLDFFTKKTKDLVKEVIISNRLVTSPCAIVVDSYGYSANMEKLLGKHKRLSRLLVLITHLRYSYPSTEEPDARLCSQAACSRGEPEVAID